MEAKVSSECKPVSGVYEWAARGVNTINGCSHNCAYCYAGAMKIRMGQKTKDTWRIEEPQKSNSGNKTYLGESHKLAKWDVMYPTTHDLHIQHIDLHLKTLRELLENGNRVVIVTKPSIKCVKAICDNLEDYWEQFIFRFSIGTLNNAELKKWEPNAPSVQHRLKCIEYAHSRGFNTSISMEPLLFNDAQDVIERVRPYVTHNIWIGVINNMHGAISLNRGKNSPMHAEGDKLRELLDDDYLFRLYKRYKKDKMICWKDSLKEKFGIKRPTIAGRDI